MIGPEGVGDFERCDDWIGQVGPWVIGEVEDEDVERLG